MRPEDSTPFVFNDISMTHMPARVLENQNSVRHEPMYRRKKVKLQINLLNVQNTVATNIQGDTGANTSAMDILEYLHDYKPFQRVESVGVYLQNNNTSETVTLEAHGSGYIYIYDL